MVTRFVDSRWQAVIQTVLLISNFDQRLSFGMLKNAGGDLEVL